jgi:hypothetical protein
MTVNRANVYATLAHDCRGGILPPPARIYCGDHTIDLVVDTRDDVDMWARWRHSTTPSVAGGMYRTVWTPPDLWCGAVRVTVSTMATQLPVWASSGLAGMS